MCEETSSVPPGIAFLDKRLSRSALTPVKQGLRCPQHMESGTASVSHSQDQHA